MTVEPITGENQILVRSPVEPLYGHLIAAAAEELLLQYGITHGCRIEITDCNALDYVIRARIETAITRSIRGKQT